MAEGIVRIKKQIEQIKNEKEAVIKTLQAQRARFHAVEEEEEDNLTTEASSATIRNLEIASKVLSFIKWNTNLSLIEAEIIDNYKAYVDELLEYVEGVASNDELLQEAQEELAASSMEKEKHLSRIEELGNENETLKMELNEIETKKIEAEMKKETDELPLTEERKKELETIYDEMKTHTEYMSMFNPRRRNMTQHDRDYLTEINKKIKKFEGKSNIELYWERKRSMERKEINDKKQEIFMSNQQESNDKSWVGKDSKSHTMAATRAGMKESSKISSFTAIHAQNVNEDFDSKKEEIKNDEDYDETKEDEDQTEDGG